MTVYILHGGMTAEPLASNEAFFQLMADYVPDGGMWLGCYFARVADGEAQKYAEDSQRMRTLGQGRFQVAMAVVSEFPEQLKRADVVYFAGGNTNGLMAQTRTWPELKIWLQTVKVVAGSSAGMNMLGRGYISKDGTRGQGLGLVPYNMLVHHRAEAYRDVHAQGPQAPWLALHEAQFCVVEI